jgi:hypothetical protein
MKKLRSIAIIVLVIASNVSYGDMIPENTTYVGVCMQITNINDYPDISLLVRNSIVYNSSYSSNIINSNSCFSSGSKYSYITIYAVKSSYIADKTVTSIDWSKDKNALKSNITTFLHSNYMSGMSTVDSIKQYYKIVGFTDTSVVMYEWKEITKYNNGQADNVVLKSYQGNAGSLSQTLTTDSKIVNNNSSFVLSPNPTSKNLHLKINNNYYGNILVRITSTDGKVVKTSSVIKDSSFLDFLLYVDMLKKGYYVVSIIMDKTIESKRLVIQ